MKSEEFDIQFGQALEQSLPPFSPQVKARALEAVARCRPVRTRLQPRGLAVSRRLVLTTAIVFAGVLGGLALWQVPGRRGDAALAAVAEAMAHVRSAHFVGWDPHHGPSGGRDRIEGWFEPRRACETEGKGAFQIVTHLEENRAVEIRSENGITEVTINPLPPELADSLKQRQGFLRALPLMWPQAAEDELQRAGARVTRSERTRLHDGRSALVVDLTAGQRTRRLTVDEATNLVTRVQEYRGGALQGAIEKIEYNVDIPAKVFEVSVPKGAFVVDNLTSPPEEPAAEGKVPAPAKPTEQYQILSATKGSAGASCTGPFHAHLRFEVVSDDEVTIAYIPKTNAYRVTGEVRVLGMGLNMVVKNAEIIAPRPPDVTPEQYEVERARQLREALRRMPPPEVRRQWAAKAEELKAAGAQDLGEAGRMFETSGFVFHSLNNRVIHIWYLRSRNAFYVMGKARVGGPGVDQVVEDGWVKVSGPPLELRQYSGR
jgi:hypothetical protein